MWRVLRRLCRAIIAVASQAGGTVLVYNWNHEKRMLLHELEVIGQQAAPIYADVKKTLDNKRTEFNRDGVMVDMHNPQLQRQLGVIPPWQKWGISLGQLHQKLLGRSFDDAHNAAADSAATAQCFFEFERRTCPAASVRP